MKMMVARADARLASLRLRPLLFRIVKDPRSLVPEDLSARRMGFRVAPRKVFARQRSNVVAEGGQPRPAVKGRFLIGN